MSNINPNCDGDHCTVENGEVRIYPLGGAGNLLMCQSCFAHENRYRYRMGVKYKRPEDWPQLNWDSAERYE